MVRYGWMTHHTPPKDYHVKEKVKEHPIFQHLSSEQFEELYQNCQERLYKQGTMIADAQKRREGILLVVDGTAEVCAAGEEQELSEVLEVVQTGEILGLGSLHTFLEAHSFDEYAYMVGIRAVDSVVGLFVPYAVLEVLWEKEEIRTYFLHEVVTRLKDVYVSLAEQVKLAQQFGESEPFLRRVQDIMTVPVLTVEEHQSIQEAAKRMTSIKASSVVVVNSDQLVGLVTKNDLIGRVISTGRSVEEPIRNVMTRSPLTIHKSNYYYQALSGLILNGVHHYPVLDDNQKVVGMITLSDLLRKKNYQMFSAIHKVEQLNQHNLHEVKHEIYTVVSIMMKDQVPVAHILDVITQLYDRLARRAVELAIQSLEEKGEGKPPASFVWYQMGSAGRGEQFVLTDQDHFLVYEDGEDDQKEMIDEYFNKLGKEITNFLLQAGYERCPGGMMASEEEWQGSLSQWSATLRGWSIRATNDAMLKAQNFFSFRKVYGSQSVHQLFLSLIQQNIERSHIMLHRLAQVEKENPIPNLGQPIRSMLKLNRKQLDVKKEVLFPFHHALQILSLSNLIMEGTTFEKLEKLVKQHVITEEEGKEVSQAFSQVMSIYMKHKWDNLSSESSSSSIILFSRLATWEKELLINALKRLKIIQSRMYSTFPI
ncbi:CBS domain-containing protein [Pontibacillus yanchengensis]|uniref:CBS domain-containing protein n=1 Tax=Pontibacillus yanchengensis TaxID=462910 RepID=A0ACC7VL95_9BACI|nr:CBS domain-containing protein [Pontibacillus yanchengensis]